jgi:hypothetical protein
MRKTLQWQWIIATVLALVAILMSLPGRAACALSDITVKSMQAKFVNECEQSPCVHLKGAAVLTNDCAEPVGVQVTITAHAQSGARVAGQDWWLASHKNIPPGDYRFSMDYGIDYEPGMATVDLKPTRIKRWP